MKPKEFFRRWRQGIRDLPPSEQLRVKLIGHIGMIVGILIAGFFLIKKGMWYFIFMFIFIILLQVIEIIGTNQRFKATLEMERQIELNQLEELKR